LNRLLPAVSAFLFSVSALAQQPAPARAAESSMAMFMYITVGVIIVGGLLAAYIKSRNDAKKDVRKP
jgi:hypothetical protein